MTWRHAETERDIEVNLGGDMAFRQEIILRNTKDNTIMGIFGVYAYQDIKSF